MNAIKIVIIMGLLSCEALMTDQIEYEVKDHSIRELQPAGGTVAQIIDYYMPDYDSYTTTNVYFDGEGNSYIAYILYKDGAPIVTITLINYDGGPVEDFGWHVHSRRWW